MEKTDYEKLCDSITSTYKKTNDDHVHSTNEAGKRIVEKLELADRMERLQTSEASKTTKRSSLLSLLLG